MFGKRFWYLKLSLVVALAGFGGNALFNEKDHYNILETSMLGILRNVAVEKQTMAADLEIVDVHLEMVAEPKEFFDFYRYKADVLVSNLGGDLEDGAVRVKVKGGKEEVFLMNLNIGHDSQYLMEGLEVLLPGGFNFQKLDLVVELTNQKEVVVDNNIYPLMIHGLSSRMEITKELLEKARDEGLEVWYSSKISARSQDYHESLKDDFVESYGVIAMSENLLEEGGFKQISGYQGQSGFFFLKDVDGEAYRVSDVLHLEEEEILTRTEFGHLLLEELGLEIEKPEVEFLADVPLDSEFAEEIYKIYGLGILKDEEGFFRPEEVMSRAEVLQAVLDYFDVDFVEDGEVNFADVKGDESFYPYLMVLAGGQKLGGFGEEFRPEDPATNSFLTFLINEYR